MLFNINININININLEIYVEKKIASIDIVFKDAVESGIICIMSGSVVGGRNVVIKTHGTIIDKMIVKNSVGFKVSLGENMLSKYEINNKCSVTRFEKVTDLGFNK